MKTKSLILNGQLAAFWVQKEEVGAVEHWHFVADGSDRGGELITHSVDLPGDRRFPSNFND